MHDVDPVLAPFLHSTDESESDRLLGELILEHAAPIIRQVLSQRLGFHLSRLGTNPDKPHAEDLYLEAIKEIVKRLRELQSDPAGKGIERFDQYVQRVAVNICHNYLRSKAPRRYHLKSNLRYLLESHKGFKIWKGSNKIILCGFANWPEKKSAMISELDDEQLQELAERCNTGGISLQDSELDKVVAEIFTFAGGPIEFDALVEIVATLQGTKDQPVESLEYCEPNQIQRIADSSPRADELLEERERITEIWEEFRRLPLEQRLAICLRFEDKYVDDLWSMLWDAGIYTPRQLAEEFGMSVEELTKLWWKIPLSNADIAEHFGVRKQQVSQWRSRGWDKLKRLISNRTKK
ncbi:MAG: sigma-70 family RNA polymerase sigma factor [Acidobacteria bacterium]|nr:sigma-70 family RNA polymerase sigma factor [Acidobacteriota bacterium]